MIKKFEEFTNKVNEDYEWDHKEQFIPVYVMNPDNLDIKDMVVLGGQPTFDAAVESAATYICTEQGLDFSAYQDYNMDNVKEDVYLATLHFLVENDDPAEDEEGEMPNDEYFYIFGVTKLYKPISSI